MKLNVNIHFRIIVLLSVLLLGVSRSAAQDRMNPDAKALWANVRNSPPDTGRVYRLMELSRFYGNTKEDPDSALIIAEEAVRLAERLKFPVPLYGALKLKGGILLWKNRIPAAMACFDRVIVYIRKKKDLAAEAAIYMYIAKKVSNKFPENYPLKISFFEKARDVYRKLGQFPLELEARNYVTRMHMEQGQLDLAENECLQQLADAKAAGYTNLKLIYLGLSEIALAKADPAKELYYELEILKLCDAAGNSLSINQWRNHIYISLSTAYNSLKRYRESEDISRKGIALSKEIKDSDMFYQHIKRIGITFFLQRKYSEALATFRGAMADVPPVSNFQRRMINTLIGKCYLELDQVKLATPYFLAADKYAQNMAEEFFNNAILESYQGIHYIEMAHYYFKAGEYGRAQDFLVKFHRMKGDPALIANRIDAMQLQISIDTARGDYSSAFHHLTEFRAMNDSINNSNNDRTIANLMFKYDSEKKDRDLVLRQQSIDLLTKEKQIQEGRLLQAGLEIRLEKQERQRQQELNALAAERKDSRISLLNKQSQIQTARLEKADLLRNVTIFGLVLTLAIIALLYHSYRLKKKNNRQLTFQKNEIDLKNQHLRKLVVEKEWLLKELHHRVKNNLQIVMSLLNIQGYYLEDPSALNAIRDTQHRIHSISLIHKKLYLSENVGAISMPGYISDLVNDLKQSFATGQQIQFRVQVDEVSLDASQAVPLGLILNEAVTNCIKYAFPLDRAGIITVTLEQQGADALVATIADNGVGLPEDFDNGRHGSLGMSMIRGLSGDLDGQCIIAGSNGTAVSVEFPYHPVAMRVGEKGVIEKV